MNKALCMNTGIKLEGLVAGRAAEGKKTDFKDHFQTLQVNMVNI